MIGARGNIGAVCECVWGCSEPLLPSLCVRPTHMQPPALNPQPKPWPPAPPPQNLTPSLNAILTPNPRPYPPA